MAYQQFLMRLATAIEHIDSDGDEDILFTNVCKKVLCDNIPQDVKASITYYMSRVDHFNMNCYEDDTRGMKRRKSE